MGDLKLLSRAAFFVSLAGLAQRIACLGAGMRDLRDPWIRKVGGEDQCYQLEAGIEGHFKLPQVFCIGDVGEPEKMDLEMFHSEASGFTDWRGPWALRDYPLRMWGLGKLVSLGKAVSS